MDVEGLSSSLSLELSKKRVAFYLLYLVPLHVARVLPTRVARRMQ